MTRDDPLSPPFVQSLAGRVAFYGAMVPVLPLVFWADGFPTLPAPGVVGIYIGVCIALGIGFAVVIPSVGTLGRMSLMVACVFLSSAVFEGGPSAVEEVGAVAFVVAMGVADISRAFRSPDGRAAEAATEGS
jgi:hypothetical protein